MPIIVHKYSGVAEMIMILITIPGSRPAQPLVEFGPGSPWFNFPAALVNSQLVCLRPVGILNSCCCCSVLSFRCVSLALKSPYGERPIKYVLYCIVLMITSIPVSGCTTSMASVGETIINIGSYKLLVMVHVH